MPKRILVVEDDKHLLALLERRLRMAGYEVVGVMDLHSARRQVRLAPPDLVLLDIQLPDGHGLDLLEALKEEVPEADTVVMTGLADLSVAIRVMQEGAYDFLAKPFDGDAILEVVGRCFKDQAARKGIDPGIPTCDTTGGRYHLIGTDPTMVEVFKLIGIAATSQSPVLIRGASGTGKELVARAIHQHYGPDEPFVAVNCAALPDSLLESELFGHEKGSFTGAVSSRKGSFELAGRGTILLDEIGDMSQLTQAKLLRVLQGREFTPLGAERSRVFRARVIAATHRDLEAMIEAGEFRSDLYFRLRVIEIIIPPLRERRQDIPRLSRFLLHSAAKRLGKKVYLIPDHVMDYFLAYDWPGNVRELENAITRAVAMAHGPTISLEGLEIPQRPEEGQDLRTGRAIGPEELHGSSAAGPAAAEEPEELDAVIESHTRTILARSGGNKREAARRLGISPARLYRILSET